MADLRKRIGEVVGSYKGTSVKMVSKQTFEEMDLNDEYIYAVVDGSTQIPLVKYGKIIGMMNPQGDVDDCRSKKYPYPKKEEVKEVYKSPEVTAPSVGGDIDIDKFIRDSLAVDLLAGGAEAMGVVETSSKEKKKQATYDFV